MRYKILGPFEVTDDAGRPLALGGRKQRAVLAILVLHAGDVVSSDRLIDRLWGDQPPATAAKTLQVYVSNLRKALGGGVLITRDRGYALEIEPGQIDFERFQRLAKSGHGALQASDPRGARHALGEALGLWRGPPLADLEYEPFAQDEIARIEDAHLSGLEDRIEADLALAESGGLVGELEALVRDHPLRERLRGQLMLALYRAGRQAEALAVYREFGRVLRDELGLEPSTPLLELERSILQHDPALAAAPRATARPAGNLPVAPTPFLGRKEELGEITALLRTETRLLTLTGPGGSGKTRLALKLGETLATEYRDGAWFVGFADITDPELIIPTVCQTLDVAEQPGVAPTRRLRDWLRERELLLVLDNFEQIAAGSTVLAELLGDCRGVTMVVTSRESLHLMGEYQYDVSGLQPQDGIELFTSRARAIAPRLIIPDEVTRAICERLDGLPLAIELAAARTKAIAPIDMIMRLDRRLPLLTEGPRDAPHRQRTLEATIDWSYELLTDAQQRLFRRLAVFAGGCTLSAADAVCDADLDTLHALIDRSLLYMDGGNYRMLQTLREYALEKLAEAGETSARRASHARWFVDMVDSESLNLFGQVDPALLVSERENFRGALEWASQVGDNETVARLAAPLAWSLWGREGRLNELEHWLSIASEHLEEYPLSVRAHVLSAARLLARRRGEYEHGWELCDQALATYRQLGDEEGICWELMNRGALAAERGDPAAGRSAFEEEILFARDRDLLVFLPGGLSSLADIEIADGRLDEARTLCEEALTLPDRSSFDTGVSLINLAHIANLQGRYGDSTNFGLAALGVALDHENRHMVAAAALEIAWSAAEQGEPEQAARLLGAAIEFFAETGVTRQRTDTKCEQAALHAMRDRLDEQTVQALIREGRTMPIDQLAQLQPRPD
jgi:predicted ATPase/DNA-binding SARP family transcriptional activator